MPQIASIILQVISFFFANKDAIKTLILDIEGLIPDAPGATKAGQVKSFIAASLGVETQIETAWPFLSPIFNAFVSITKGKPIPVPAPVPPAQ